MNRRDPKVSRAAVALLALIVLVLPAAAQEADRMNLDPVIVDKNGEPINRAGQLPPGYTPSPIAEEPAPPAVEPIRPEPPVVEEIARPEIETPPPDLREAPEAPEVAELPELDLSRPVLRQLEEAPELALEPPDLREGIPPLLPPAGLPPLAVDDAPEIRETPLAGELPRLAGLEPVLREDGAQGSLASELPPLASQDPAFRSGEGELPLMAEGPALRSGELPPLAAADPRMAGIFVGEVRPLPPLPSSQIAGIAGGEKPLPRLPSSLLAGVTGPQRELTIPETVVVVPPEDRVERLNVLLPQGIRVNVPVAIVVEAVDAEGRVVTGYEAPVVFQSSVSVEPQVARLTNGRYEGTLVFKETGPSVQLAISAGNEGAQLAFAVLPPPPSFDQLYKEGLALYQGGETDEALAKFNEAARVGSSYDLHMLRGKIYLNQGQLQASMEAFKEATSALFTSSAG